MKKTKKNKPITIEEYELKPENEEIHKDNMLEADKTLADILIRHHKAKKK